MLYKTDVLIIGSGCSGLSVALNIRSNYSIKIITNSYLGEGSSSYAQGGIASVFGKDDSYLSHIQDTIITGDGLCDRQSVEFSVNNAPKCINWLIKQGVNFTTLKKKNCNNSNNLYHLGQEGGHSHRRIFHVNDETGKNIQDILKKNVLNKKNIQYFEKFCMIDFICSLFDSNIEKRLNNFRSRIRGKYPLKKADPLIYKSSLPSLLISPTVNAGPYWDSL